MFLNTVNGGAFNFRVLAIASYENMVAYHVPPENTIGVETDPSSYDRVVVSPTQPDPLKDEYHSERLLWIKTDNAGPVDVQVTKYIPVHIIPTNVYLCTNGGLKLLRAAVYVNGKWVSISKMNLLNSYWGGKPLGYSGSGVDLKATIDDNGAVTVDCTEEKVGTDAKLGTFVSEFKRYDLTNYKKLTFKGLFAYENSNSSAIYGCLTPSDQGYTSYKDIMAASVTHTANNTADVVIDVSSLKGEYYIGVGVRSARVRIDECYLEM